MSRGMKKPANFLLLMAMGQEITRTKRPLNRKEIRLPE